MKDLLIQMKDVPEKEMLPGFIGKMIHTEQMTFALWKIKKGSTLPEHHHPHEQITHVLKGTFEMTLNGKLYNCVPDQVLVIPSNHPHGGVALTDCEILDVFVPRRDDYMD